MSGAGSGRSAIAQLRDRRNASDPGGDGSRSASDAASTAAAGSSIDRFRVAAICIVLVALVFAQSSVEIVGDTKYDLVVDPVRFLGRSLHLWDPSAAFGQLQDQAYGYLFPMGPFFAVGHALRLPEWGIQRAWQSVILIGAFLGMRALATRLGIGTPNTRLVGAVVYALSPLLVSELGPLSAEALTEALAPWVLLPLVGDRALVRPRLAAARSGVAILLAGGVNATVTGALLVLPALWLLTRPRGTRRRLTAWWVVGAGLATLWWLAPLVVLGKYSPPFTDWIEAAATTTSTTGLLNLFSGTENWVGHLTSGAGPVWRGGWALATSRTALIDESIAAAFGVVGLMRPSLPHRRFLGLSALVGLVALSVGHVGALDPALAMPGQHALDGTFAAFRNLQKLDLVLRVPLALGLIHLSTEVTGRLSSRLVRVTGQAVFRPVAALSCVSIIGLAVPLLTHQLEPYGGFEVMPTWWPQAAAYLASHDDGSRSLLLPASSEGGYFWGLPEDEPMQALARTPWAVRDALPLGGAGEARLLDAVDEQIETGQGSTGLAPYLARAGVGYLVVRNDLNPALQSVTPPAVVRAALQDSPGITRVAAFGVPTGDPGTGPDVVSDGVTVAVPDVEIYQVAGPAPRISTQSVAGTLRVSGNVESLLPMITHGELSPSTATVMAASPAVSAADTQSEHRMVTDGYRHAENNFGRVTDTYSSTLLPGQPWSLPRSAHDYDTGSPSGHQTTAVVYGATTVRASSSASDASAFWLDDQDAGPVGAFDGDPTTTWISGGITAVGQWVEDELFGDPAPTTITVSSPSLPAIDKPAMQARITTQAGSELVPVSPTPRTYPLPPGHTSRVRLTVTKVAGGGLGRIASLSAEVSGVPPASVGLAVPADGSSTTGGQPSATPASFSFTALPQDDGCLHLTSPRRTICSPSLLTNSEDDLGLDRAFTLDQPASYSPAMTAVARGGGALDGVLPHPAAVRLTVSSRAVDDPADGVLAMTDGNRTTGWIAAPTDVKPTVTVHLSRPRTVTSIDLPASAGLPASAPTSVVVSVPRSVPEVATIEPDGTAALPAPVHARTLTLRLVAAHVRPDLGAFVPQSLPVGVCELRLHYAGGGRSGTVAPTTPVAEPCGQGPPLQVDGRLVPTSVSGTVAEVMADRDLAVTACGTGHGVQQLAIGAHRAVFTGTPTMRPTALVLTPAVVPPQTTAPRPVSVTSWHADTRSVRVAGGAAAWLVMPENANPGWQATMAGRRLPSAVVDGWKQAFLLPAGAGGIVSLRYAPDRAYRLALLIGGLLALLLVAGALVPQRRLLRLPLVGTTSPVRRQPAYVRWLRPAGALTGLLAAPLIGGSAGWVCVAGVVIVAGVAHLFGQRTRCLQIVAGGCLVVAGLLGSGHPFAGAAPSHGVDEAEELLCLVAVAALSISLSSPLLRPSSGAAVPAASDPPAARSVT